MQQLPSQFWKTDTHSFDGKWKENVTKISSHILYRRAAELSAIGQNFDTLKKLRSNISQGQQYFDLICNDEKSNWDSANNINALTLLCFISLIAENNERKNKNADMYKTLGEQLQDMSTGTCPQGRTTRLAQIIIAFLDD